MNAAVVMLSVAWGLFFVLAAALAPAVYAPTRERATVAWWSLWAFAMVLATAGLIELALE